MCRSVQQLFSDEGKEYYDVYRNVKPTKKISEIYGNGEYDIVAVNGNEILVTEVKSTLKYDHINKFLNIQLPKFTTLFPQYKGYSIIGAVGGALVTPQVEKYAQKNGLYVVVQNGLNL